MHVPRLRVVALSLILAAAMLVGVAPGPAVAGAKPSISGLSTSSGTTAGGTRITITGKRLANVTAVLFGAKPGRDLRSLSATRLKITTPAHAAGTLHVRVVTKNGTSKKVAADRFRFVAPVTCGVVNMAVLPWAGYQANAYVVGNLLQTLGCPVTYKPISSSNPDLPWFAMTNNGEISVIIEDWPDPRHDPWFEEGDGAVNGTARNLGPTGNSGGGGWYVPPWLAAAHPDVLDWTHLNDYAEEFETPASGGQGQVLSMSGLGAEVDAGIIENLGLDFTAVVSGSEAATVAAFRKAEQDQEFLIGYFYEPSWLFDGLDLQRVSLPTDTDFEHFELRKVAATVWVEQGGPGVRLVRRFHWTNADQDLVASYIVEDDMEPADAAAKWIADNPDTVAAWLS